MLLLHPRGGRRSRNHDRAQRCDRLAQRTPCRECERVLDAPRPPAKDEVLSDRPARGIENEIAAPASPDHAAESSPRLAPEDVVEPVAAGEERKVPRRFARRQTNQVKPVVALACAPAGLEVHAAARVERGGHPPRADRTQQTRRAADPTVEPADRDESHRLHPRLRARGHRRRDRLLRITESKEDGSEGCRRRCSRNRTRRPSTQPGHPRCAARRRVTSRALRGPYVSCLNGSSLRISSRSLRLNVYVRRTGSTP
jgi:hypothetical protein